MHDQPPATDALLADIGWLRGLARRLVADEHAADDLAQATVAAALERGREHAAPRAWLAAVLRNGLRRRARDEAHRRERELAAVRTKSQASPAELLETIEAHRELLDALQGLPEPCRTAVTLRYLRGLPPRRIARELGLTPAVVSAHVTNGVRLMRARLTARHRGSAAWMALFLPLALEAPRVSTGIAGAILVNTKLVVAASFFAIAAVVAVLALRDEDSAPNARVELAALETPAGAGNSRADVLDEVPSEAREEMGSTESATAVAETVVPAGATPSLRRLRGRVFDASGDPLASCGLSSSQAVAGDELRSGAGGWFELTTRAASGSIECAGGDWVTVRAGVFDGASSSPPIVIAARAIDVAGVVRDEEGRELRGARIDLEMPRAFGTRFPQSLEGTRPLGWSAASAAGGRFEIARLPSIPGAEFSVALDGYEPWRGPAPVETNGELEFVLARPRAPLEGVLAGIVRDPLRKPVAGARVAIGLTAATTDEDGEFELDLARAVTADELRAVAPGFAPALVARPYEPRDGDRGWPQYVEVDLPAAALVLRGRVVDHDGAPQPGVRVSLAEPTPFGTIGMMPASAEALAAGAPVPPQATASLADMPSEDGDSFFDMHMRVGPPTALWHWVETDGDGRFAIGGLAPRAYRVKVLDRTTLISFVSDPIDARDGEATIRMSRPQTWELLAGRVVSRFGAPLANVTLTPVHEAFGVRARVFGGNVYVSLRDKIAAVRTDESGAFELANLPKSGVVLSLSGGEIVPLEYALDDVKEPRALEIVCDVRCRVEVVLDEPFDRADSVAVLDGEGRGLDALVITDGSINAYTDVPLVDGRSAVFATSSQAAEIVLLKDGVVVARTPVRLSPGAPNVLRL